MLYVVENGQSSHFATLFSMAERLLPPSRRTLTHVKFGRVSGMSSRRPGSAVLLADILDEAAARAGRQRAGSPNTRGTSEEEKVADVLGATAVAVNDMKQRRNAG